jgi:hypothetical protein
MQQHYKFVSAVRKLIRIEAKALAASTAATTTATARTDNTSSAAASAAADSKAAPASTTTVSAPQSELTRVVILEIGAGLNVPTVRFQSEELLVMLPQAQCTLIRVNADFPLCKILNIRHTNSGGSRTVRTDPLSFLSRLHMCPPLIMILHDWCLRVQPPNVISLMAKGLDAVTEINKYL